MINKRLYRTIQENGMKSFLNYYGPIEIPGAQLIAYRFINNLWSRCNFSIIKIIKTLGVSKKEGVDLEYYLQVMYLQIEAANED